MLLEIHKATTSDIAELVQIRNEALTYKLSHGDKAWEEAPFTQEEMSEAVARDSLYLVLVGGKPAGSVVLHWEDRHNWGEVGGDKQAGYVANLAVRDAFRGQHIGEQIIAWATHEIQKAGRKFVRLDCPAANQKLCAYYEQQGFGRTGTNMAGEALYELAV